MPATERIAVRPRPRAAAWPPTTSSPPTVAGIDVSEQLALTDVFVIASAPHRATGRRHRRRGRGPAARAGRQADPPRGRARGPLGAARLRRHRRARPARRGARVLRARAALEGLPGDRPGAVAAPARRGASAADARRGVTAAARCRPAGPRRVVIVRHAETVDNAAGVWQGHKDTELSDRRPRAGAGRGAAPRGLRRRRSSSRRPATRGRDRRAIAGLTGREVRLDPRLREIHVGEWAGPARRTRCASATPTSSRPWTAVRTSREGSTGRPWPRSRSAPGRRCATIVDELGPGETAVVVGPRGLGPGRRRRAASGSTRTRRTRCSAGSTTATGPSSSRPVRASREVARWRISGWNLGPWNV